MGVGLLAWWHNLCKPKVKNDELIEFLESADDRYLEALETKDITLITSFVTLELYRELRENWEERSAVIVGPPRYRIRKWLLIRQDPTASIYRRSVNYKDVNIKGIRLAVGDSLVETWQVSSRDRKVIRII